MNSESEWQSGKPPNETLVEVEWQGGVIRVMAFYGRDGVLPHWRTKDGNQCWSPGFFDRWRPITESEIPW